MSRSLWCASAGWLVQHLSTSVSVFERSNGGGAKPEGGGAAAHQGGGCVRIPKTGRHGTGSHGNVALRLEPRFAVLSKSHRDDLSFLIFHK